jgi:integrase
MAWLYKNPRSRFWFIGWRIGKKVFNRSTKVTDRKEAEKHLATYNLMADANQAKRLTEDFFNSLTGRELERIPLRDGADKFLEKCKGTTQPGTFVRYRMVIDSLLEYLHASDTAPLLGDVTSEVIQQFLNDARGRTSATTANFYRKVLNAFFAHALENKKITSNPVKGIGTFKASKEEIEISRRPFELSEIRDAYNVAPNNFWRFAIVFGLYTGLRLGNVVTLRWRDVDLTRKLVNVVDIKSPDKLQIPIESPFLLNTLAELRRRSPKARPEHFLFPDYARIYLNKSKDGENNSADLSREFRGILVKAKLLGKYERKEQGTGRSCRRPVSALSFHSLRHNFVTMLKERGASQMVARELVGHDSDAVNELYTHTSPEIVRRSLKKLPEVFK